MAETATMEAQRESVSADDLKRTIGEITRQKENAAEYAGMAGQVTRNAIEQYGLDRVALAFVLRLEKMEDGNREGTVIALLDYCEKLGHLDPGIIPDELLARLQSIIDRTHNRAPAPISDDDASINDRLIN